MKHAMNIDTLACWILNTTRSYQLYHPFVGPEFISFFFLSPPVCQSLATHPCHSPWLRHSKEFFIRRTWRKETHSFQSGQSWLFCAEKKSTNKIHWYIWYAERTSITWPCHLHSRNATRNSPIKKWLLGMLWWCLSLQWSRGTSSGLGILFSQGPVVWHEMRISLANSEFLPFSKEINTLVYRQFYRKLLVFNPNYIG